MKLSTYIHKGIQKAGALSRDGSRVYAFDELGFDFKSIQDFIERHTPAEFERLSKLLCENPQSGAALSEIKLCAPIPNPRHDLICIGQNYIAHAAEAAKFLGLEYIKPEHPVYFSKRIDVAVPSGGFIPSHSDITSQLDYEGELAVIIGKTCSHVREEDVYDYVFGYTIVNDVSARNIQNNHKQYMFGKSLDGAAPMGPFIVTADEIGPPPKLSIKTKVNGELRQNDSTENLIFPIAELISRLSAGITLIPGDIIITGTPAGVGAGFDPPKFLRPGDVVECEIESIGTLVNTVK